jgi:polar amino acid transport system permease protein
MTFRFDVAWDNFGFIASGIYLTLLLSGLALALSLVLGACVALLRMAPWRPVGVFAAFYVEVLRDTPVLVQLFWVYYVLPALLDIRLSAFAAALICLTLHSSAYLSEIYRAGIEAVPRGQVEAARVIGLRPSQTFFRIVMPQALQTVLPPMVNNFIDLIKMSSLASVLAVGEITRKATELSASTFRPTEIFTLVAVLYFVICWPLSMMFRTLERRRRAART